MIVGHVRPIHCAQRNPHCLRNRRLRHPAFNLSSECAAAEPRAFSSAMLSPWRFVHLTICPSRSRWPEGNHTFSLAGDTELPQTRRFSQLSKRYKPGIQVLRYSRAAPAIRDIQSSDRSRWHSRHKRPRRNVVRHDGAGRDDSVVANGHAGKDRRRTTDPDVGTKTNWRNAGWTRRFCGMVVRVENSRQVPDQAIVTDKDTVIGHDSRTSVDEDTLAEHKGAILGSAHLDWYRLRA
jgi:hypothetical protein